MCATTQSEQELETNVSARWKMQRQVTNCLPVLASVTMDDVERCIYVYEHWQCIGGNHPPSPALPPSFDTSMFVIDEVYEQYSWALNFLDPDRWEENEELLVS